MGVVGDLIAGDAMPEQYVGAAVVFVIAVYLVISAAKFLEERAARLDAPVGYLLGRPVKLARHLEILKTGGNLQLAGAPDAFYKSTLVLRWTARSNRLLEASVGRLLFRIEPDGLLSRLTVLRARLEAAEHQGQRFELLEHLHAERCADRFHAAAAAGAWLRANPGQIGETA